MFCFCLASNIAMFPNLQLESTIAALRERLEAMQKEANEIKTKYNLQVEPMR